MPAAQTRSDIRTYKGVGVSPGIATARALIVEKRVAQVYRIPVREEEVESELRRFNESLDKTREELLDLKQKVSRSMGEEYAQIFEAHAMIVSDASFAERHSAVVGSAAWANPAPSAANAGTVARTVARTI